MSEDKVADVYSAALGYVSARIRNEDEEAQRASTVDVDRAYHELAYYVLGRCRYCDPDTCPLEGDQ